MHSVQRFVLRAAGADADSRQALSAGGRYPACFSAAEVVTAAAVAPLRNNAGDASTAPPLRVVASVGEGAGAARAPLSAGPSWPGPPVRVAAGPTARLRVSGEAGESRVNRRLRAPAALLDRSTPYPHHADAFMRRPAALLMRNATGTPVSKNAPARTDEAPAA